MPHFCRNCGLNVIPDPEIGIRDWRLWPDAVVLGGKLREDLSPQECGFLYNLAAVAPQTMSRDEIGHRISDRANYGNLVSVLASTVKKKLGRKTPFVTIHKKGYRWVDFP